MTSNMTRWCNSPNRKKQKVIETVVKVFENDET